MINYKGVEGSGRGLT